MSPKPRLGIQRWIWRAFLQSALVPLVLVEIGLITVYLVSNHSIRDAQVEYLRESALSEVRNAAANETRMIQDHLERVVRTTDFYRNLTTQTLLGGERPALDNLTLSEDGVRFKPRDDGGAGIFYSNATPADQHDLGKVAKLTTLDPIMREIKAQNPLVASIYFNGWDSYNHIYPWFDTASQYPHDMVIPHYNFYYLADALHDPQRQVVWTDVYLDPAGQGWMMSAIAPVYRGDFLEGVVGVDLTVNGILEEISQLQVPWNGYAMLVSQDLNIMALPAPGERDFGLDELTSHSYLDAVRQETFKPADFNLLARDQTRDLARAISASANGVQPLMLGGRPQLVAWSTIEQTGWRLLTVVDETNVFQQTNAIAARYQRIGYLLIGGLLLFYVLFFLFMWRRTRRLSQTLLQPVAGISRMMAEIGRGQWRPARIDSPIEELQTMGDNTLAMGLRLEESEAKLLAASDDAQAASRAKSRFISSMSHELKTPLNAIQGFAQLLQMEQAAQTDKSPHVDEILAASRHLQQLLDDILDWSGAQREVRRVELVPVAVRSILRECSELIRLELQAQGLVLRLDLPQDEILVRADARRLRQVLLNLLSNAIKYNRDNGVVTLGCELHKDRARLYVKDTGIGIDRALQSQLFEPFQRLGQENSSIQGTGIGLALCREYAGLMAGEMGLTSERGIGSVFWIELPLATLASLGKPAGSGEGRSTILYVEDNPPSQLLVRKALADLAAVATCDDGLLALDRILADPPDLILLDLNLPGLNGDDLLRRLRRDAHTASLPVILLTAATEEEFARLADLDCQGLLRKPVDLRELRELVTSVLADRAQFRLLLPEP